MAVARPLERFWPKVDRSGGPDACWPWRQSRDLRGGYGQFHDWPRVLKAHRVAYELTKGPIPAGLQVRHTCDNPPCVNPTHLIVGTDAENRTDMVRRGRSLTGARDPQYKPDAIRHACGHTVRAGRTVCARGCSHVRAAA